MKHFLANERHRAQTQKRGGQVRFIGWEAADPEARYAGAATQSDNPEHIFDREWALETVSGALQALRDEMVRAGKSKQFDALAVFVGINARKAPLNGMTPLGEFS